MATIVHNEAAILEARAGENPKYPNTVYFSVVDDNGTFNYSTEVIPLVDLLKNRLVKSTIQVKTRGRVYQNKQMLECQSMDLKPAVSAPAVPQK